MVRILAHRGNVHGPCPAGENRPAAVAEALSRGWGVEIDIRRARDGRFYVSHDAREAADGFEAEHVCAMLRAHPQAVAAINVKETGDEAALLAFVDRQGILPQSLLFDMELVEARAGESARLFRRLHPTVRLAARVSDRGEPIDRALRIPEASVIWLDEFDGPWAAAGDVRRLKAAGRSIYAVSPDLHGFSREATRNRWRQFLAWGVDGICTDYPAGLARVLQRTAREPAA